MKPGLVYWVMETAIIVAATAAAAESDSAEPEAGVHTVAHVSAVHVPERPDRSEAYMLTRLLIPLAPRWPDMPRSGKRRVLFPQDCSHSATVQPAAYAHA